MADDSDLQKFPGLPNDLRDAVALVQAQLKESLSAIDARIQTLSNEARRRGRVAIILKVVSVLSGFVIATGFLAKSVVQVLGGVIPLIALLERAFANLDRLLAVSAAKNAYERVRRQIVAQHNNQIVAVVKIRDREPKKAANTLISFVSQLRDEIAAKEGEIEDGLSRNAYDALGRLTLQEKSEAVP